MRIVHHRWFRMAFVSALLLSNGSAQTTAPATEVQTIAQIEKAAPTDAPVRVSGVVTALDAAHVFVQDKTGAVAVMRAPSVPALAPGDACEITGTLVTPSKGLEMMPRQVVKTGTAPLPAARAMRASDVIAGKARHQRVKLTGFVHEVGLNQGEIILALETGGLTVLVVWPASGEGETKVQMPLDLLNAAVEVEGVAVPQPGNSSKASGMRVLLPGSSHLRVKQAGNADAFARPSKTLREMRDPKLDNGERYRMKGTVTYWSDAGWFYFTDGTSSARGNSEAYLRGVIGWPYRIAPGYNPPLKPGDEVEVVGMRRNLGSAIAHLVHCEWRVTGTGEPPLYEPVTVRDVLDGDYEGDAVSLAGRLDDVQIARDGQGFYNHMLWTTSDDRIIQVLVQKKQIEPVPIKPGEFFRVPGTVSFSQSSSNPKTAFRLNVNQLSDLAVLPPPPMWRNPAMARGIAIGSVVMLLGAAWIFTLRRQVKAQTAQLRESAQQLQHQLEHEKELSEMKSRFVFTVSHEFRNPLAAIMSCADVLQRTRGGISAEDHECQIDGIQQNVRRMADMMEELLLLGRSESGRLQCQPETTDVRALCLQIIDQVRSATSARCPVRLEADANLPPSRIDPGLLHHILTNLITNAVKYSPTGSEVELRIEAGESSLVFIISDHGPGISENDQAHLFEPFYRGRDVGTISGSGLGLAIVQRCVQAHGGSIQIDSQPGEGTRATVRLPVAGDESTDGA